MTKLKELNVKKTLRNFVIVWIGILILVGIFSLFSIWSINKIVNTENEKLTNTYLLTYSLTAAEGKFKSQIQSWKNILIRGHDKNDYKKYKREFSLSFAAAQNLLNNSHDICIFNNEKSIDCERIITLKDSHQNLHGTYNKNLLVSDLKQNGNYKLLDNEVRGVDRSLQNDFYQLTQELKFLYQNQVEIFKDLVNERYLQIRFFLLTVLSVAISFLILRFYKIVSLDTKDS